MRKNKNSDETEELKTEKEGEALTDEPEDEEDEFDDAAPKKKKLPNWIILVVIGVIVAIAVIGTLVSAKKGKSSSAGTALAVTKVEKGDVTEVYNASGLIKSNQEKTFYSPVNAKVSTCIAKVGEEIKSGTKVISFDTTDLEKSNQQSQLNQLSTEYANQATIESTNKSVAKAQKAADEANQAAVDQYNAIVDEYNAIVTTLDGLYQAAMTESNANAPVLAQLEAKNAELQNDEIEKEQTQNNIDHYDAYTGTKTKEELLLRLDQLVQAVSTLPAEIAALQVQVSTSAGEAYAAADAQATELYGQLQAMEGTLNAATADVDGLTGGAVGGMQVSEELAKLATLTAEELVQKGREGITADFDGVVSDVKIAEGGAAAQGSELFTLVSNKDVSVKIEAPTNDYDKLIVGRTATVTLGSNTYDGKLTSVDKIATVNAKGNSVICAYIHITNPDDNICVGVTAKVRMTVNSVAGVLTVPSEVINTSTDGEFVYMIRGGEVKKVPVEIGVTSDKTVEVKSGLKEGDEVVSDMSVDITEGMKATAVDSGTK